MCFSTHVFEGERQSASSFCAHVPHSVDPAAMPGGGCLIPLAMTSAVSDVSWQAAAPQGSLIVTSALQRGTSIHGRLVFTSVVCAERRYVEHVLRTFP